MKPETAKQEYRRSYSYPLIRPLGRVLRKAGFISKCQVRLALRDQKMCNNLRIGDIFVLRGWVKEETVEFFAQDWPKIIKKGADKPIEYYLKLAGILSDNQIEQILKEQAQTGLQFGAIAVIKGWLQQITLDFFLAHLAPEEKAHSPFVGKQDNTDNNGSQELYIGQGKITLPDKPTEMPNNIDIDLTSDLQAWNDTQPDIDPDKIDLAYVLKKPNPKFQIVSC